MVELVNREIIQRTALHLDSQDAGKDRQAIFQLKRRVPTVGPDLPQGDLHVLKTFGGERAQLLLRHIECDVADEDGPLLRDRRMA